MEDLPIPYEPLRCNRFLIEFPKIYNIESCLAIKMDNPKYNLIQRKWLDIKLDFQEIVGDNSVQYSLYNLINEFENYKADEKLPLFEIKMSHLDPTGVKVSTWLIGVKNIKEIDFGYKDYNDDSIQRSSIIIEPLYCKLIKDGDTEIN